MASPDDAVLSACKQKLGHFRIKELKDVLHQLGLPKHGKKQELVERVMTVLSDQQNLVPETNGLPKDQEKAVKIVEDTFMKMQDPTGTVAASKSHIVPKKKPDDPVKVCCPCGNSKPSISMIKCVDPQCNVWQHVGCVIIPENEKPVDSISPDLTSSFYCEICRISRADPFWVTVNNVLLPVIVGPSPIAADGSYTVQSATGDLTAPRHAANPCCLPTTPAPALRQPTRPDPAPLPPSDSSCSTGRSVWLSASQSRNIVS